MTRAGRIASSLVLALLLAAVAGTAFRLHRLRIEEASLRSETDQRSGGIASTAPSGLAPSRVEELVGRAGLADRLVLMSEAGGACRLELRSAGEAPLLSLLTELARAAGGDPLESTELTRAADGSGWDATLRIHSY